MLRLASFTIVLAGSWIAAVGCAPTPSEPDCELPPAEPTISGVHGPYAAGTYATIWTRSEQPMTIESTDPGVVRVEEIASTSDRESEVELYFVGPGRATLRLRDEVGVAERLIEVRAVRSFEVDLTAELPVRVGELDGRVLLADRQYVQVAYLDEENRSLDGYGLAEVSLSPDVERCAVASASIDRHCFGFAEAGTYTLEARVHGESKTYRFQTVPRSEIVELELLQPAEGDLEPGAKVRVEVVGVTEGGTQVSGLRAQFTADGIPYFGYFAYQYDPGALSRRLTVEALEETLYTRFRGTPSDETTFRWDCASVGPGGGGPVPQLLSLLGLVLLIRLSTRWRRGARNR